MVIFPRGSKTWGVEPKPAACCGLIINIPDFLHAHGGYRKRAGLRPAPAFYRAATGVRPYILFRLRVYKLDFGGHLAPRLAVQFSARFFLVCPAPLLEEEGNVFRSAPVADFCDPTFINMARAGA